MAKNTGLIPEEKRDLKEKMTRAEPRQIQASAENTMPQVRDKQNLLCIKTQKNNIRKNILQVTKKAREQEEFLSEVAAYVDSKDDYEHERQLKRTIQDFLDLIDDDGDDKDGSSKTNGPQVRRRRIHEGTKRVETLRQSLMGDNNSQVSSGEFERAPVGRLDPRLLDDLTQSSTNVYNRQVVGPEGGDGKRLEELRKKLEAEDNLGSAPALLKAPRNKLIPTVEPVETYKPKSKTPSKWSLGQNQAKIAQLEAISKDNANSMLQLERRQSLPSEKKDRPSLSAGSEDSLADRPASDSFSALKNIMNIVRNSAVAQAFEQSKQYFSGSQEQDLDKLVDRPEIVVTNSRGTCKAIRSKYEKNVQDEQRSSSTLPISSVPRSKSCANMKKMFEAQMEEMGRDSPSPERKSSAGSNRSAGRSGAPTGQVSDRSR